MTVGKLTQFHSFFWWISTFGCPGARSVTSDPPALPPVTTTSHLFPQIWKKPAKHVSQQAAVVNWPTGVLVFSRTNHAGLLHKIWGWEIQKMAPMWDIEREHIWINKVQQFHIICHVIPLWRVQVRILAPVIGCHGIRCILDHCVLSEALSCLSTTSSSPFVFYTSYLQI